MIIIEGPVGSGKTTVGEILHKRLPRTAFVGLDRIKYFLSDFERNKEDNILSMNVVYSMMESYLKQGCNILFPQAIWKKKKLEPYFELARKFNTDVYLYQLEAPREVLLQRIKERRKLLNLSEFTEGRAEINLTKWENNRYKLGRNLDTTKYSPDEITDIIMKDLETGSNIIHPQP